MPCRVVARAALAVAALVTASSCHSSGPSVAANPLAGPYQCGVPTSTGGGFQFAANMKVASDGGYTYGSAASGALRYDADTGAVTFASGGLSTVRNAFYLTTNDRPRIDFYVPDNGDFVLSVCYRTGGGSYAQSPADDTAVQKPTAGPPASSNAAIERSGVTSGTTEDQIARSEPFDLGAGDHTLSWNLATTSSAGIACSTDLYVVPAGATPPGGAIDYTGATAPSTGSHPFHVDTAGSYFIAASGGSGDGSCSWSATIQ